MGVRHKLEDIKRFKTIASVLSKHGFGILFDKATHGSHSLRSKPETRLRLAFEELGGAFVKLGQLLSLRPDLIPATYCAEFEKLQDQGKPITFSELKGVLAKEFSRPLETMFSKIESRPLAVGSIAQVHKATLTNGKEVVIKVLKPNTKKTFREDIDLLSFFATKVKKFVASDVINPEIIVNEFKIYTKKELDFSIELNYCEEFSKLNILLKTPKVYRELSTKEVIVMEYIRGPSLSKKIYSKWPLKIREEVAKHLALSMMKQVFINGLFHADPHPGNILVQKDYRLALIDFGIVGTVDAKTKVTLTILLYALLYKDLKLLSRSLLKLGISKHSTNREELEFDLKTTLSKYYDADLADVHISDLFIQSIAVARRNKLSIPEKFVLLGKAIATIESVCHLLNPKFKFVVIAKPFLKTHLPKLISSQFMLSQAKEEILDYGELIVNIPKDIQKLVSIKEDDHRSLEKLQGTLTRFEKELLVMQKELFTAGLGIILIILAILTNTTSSSFLGLNVTSTIMFSLGCLMLLSLLRYGLNR